MIPITTEIKDISFSCDGRKAAHHFLSPTARFLIKAGFHMIANDRRRSQDRKRSQMIADDRRR